MNVPTNHKRTKRRHLLRWMVNRHRRLFWKIKTNPAPHLGARLEQLEKQIPDAP